MKSTETVSYRVTTALNVSRVQSWDTEIGDSEASVSPKWDKWHDSFREQRVCHYCHRGRTKEGPVIAYGERLREST